MTFRFDLDAALAELRNGVDIRPTVPILPTVPTLQAADLGEIPPRPPTPTLRYDRAVRDAWAAFEAMDDMHNQEAWR